MGVESRAADKDGVEASLTVSKAGVWWSAGLLSGRKDASVTSSICRSSRRGTVETNLTSNHEIAVRSLALLSGLRTRRCCELWCRSQTWLGSGVAAAVV